MNAQIELVVRAPESAVKIAVGTVAGLATVAVDEALDRDAGARELIARMVIDWAAGYGGLETGEVRLSDG